MIFYVLNNQYDYDFTSSVARGEVARGVGGTHALGFNREVVIDDFISGIWTERFIEAGEVEIVLPASHQNLKYLAPGQLLGCGGSREVMLLETRSIEEGVAKATGKSVLKFFNERPLLPPPTNQENTDPDETDSASIAVTMSAKGGDIMKGVVNLMQEMEPTYGSGFVWRIAGLRVADPDPDEVGAVVNEDIPLGPTYDTLVNLGKKYNLGQTVVWQKIEGGDHELVYTTRQGRNLVGEVRFSTELENLGDVKQLLSVDGSKNYFQVLQPTWVNPGRFVPGQEVWSVPISTSDKNIFRDRYMLVDCTDIKKDDLDPGTDVEQMQQLYKMMSQRLFAAIEEKKKIKMVDGEVTPEAQFKYKTDYDLGDVVEVQGDFGDPIQAVVAEYVRSHDESGERAYPTFSARADNPTGPGG